MKSALDECRGSMIASAGVQGCGHCVQWSNLEKNRHYHDDELRLIGLQSLTLRDAHGACEIRTAIKINGLMLY